MDWFLYDLDLRHERVKVLSRINKISRNKHNTMTAGTSPTKANNNGFACSDLACFTLGIEK